MAHTDAGTDTLLVCITRCPVAERCLAGELLPCSAIVGSQHAAPGQLPRARAVERPYPERRGAVRQQQPADRPGRGLSGRRLGRSQPRRLLRRPLRPARRSMGQPQVAAAVGHRIPGAPRQGDAVLVRGQGPGVGAARAARRTWGGLRPDGGRAAFAGQIGFHVGLPRSVQDSRVATPFRSTSPQRNASYLPVPRGVVVPLRLRTGVTCVPCQR